MADDIDTVNSGWLDAERARLAQDAGDEDADLEVADAPWDNAEANGARRNAWVPMPPAPPDGVRPPADSGASGDDGPGFQPLEGSDSDGEPTTHKYGQTEYWDYRYTELPGAYDWLFEYSHIRDLLREPEYFTGTHPMVRQDDVIFMPGCGSAHFSRDMYDDGVESITNIDNSVVIIDRKRRENRHRRRMKWMLMDVTDCEFPDGYFDVVLDKSLMDCLFCCAGAEAICKKVADEYHRLLHDRGILIVLSLHAAKDVLKYLDNTLLEEYKYSWTAMHTTVVNPAFAKDPECSPTYSVVVCKKYPMDLTRRMFLEEHVPVDTERWKFSRFVAVLVNIFEQESAKAAGRGSDGGTADAEDEDADADADGDADAPRSAGDADGDPGVDPALEERLSVMMTDLAERSEQADLDWLDDASDEPEHEPDGESEMGFDGDAGNKDLEIDWQEVEAARGVVASAADALREAQEELQEELSGAASAAASLRGDKALLGKQGQSVLHCALEGQGA